MSESEWVDVANVVMPGVTLVCVRHCDYDGEGLYLIFQEGNNRLERIHKHGDDLITQNGTLVTGQLLGRAVAGVKTGNSL